MMTRFSLMDDLRRQVDAMFFDDFFRAPPRFATLETPRVHLVAKDDAIHLEAELPGLTKDDVKLTIEGDELSLFAERRPAAEPGYEALSRERPAFRVERTFQLPFRVTTEGASAELKNGLLSLSLRRHPEEAPKSIEVRAV